jgi:hypothetical protein
MLEYLWDRDAWIVRQKTKLVLFVFAIFFVSFVMSWTEMRYAVSSKVTDAGASTSVEHYVDHGAIRTHRVLTYNYMDGSEPRHEYIEVPMNWAHADDKNIKIQYFPGRDRSRPADLKKMVWVYIFFGSLAAAAVGTYVMVKNA